MSTLKMQESSPDDEISQLRRRATNKDIHYATLENELLKRNNDLLEVKATLDDTLYKLRNEADRALKLETDLNRRSEDLRAERVARQNLEASLISANERLKAEEIASKRLEMDLNAYAVHTSSQHQNELKQLHREKTILEARVHTLEAQSQAHQASQISNRIPCPTTSSEQGSIPPDAAIAALESELSKARGELLNMSQFLSSAQQEAAKLPHLQSKLIATENAHLRAERLASTEKVRADGIQETLRECQDELEYWKSAADERPVLQDKVEQLIKERDDAVKRENETRWCEVAMRKRLEEKEEKEVELVMEKEEALNVLHRLQAESKCDAKAGSTEEDLRSALAEREVALLKARGYVNELQQMYHDTLDACEAAEARVRNLETQHPEQKGPEPPLIIVSPPASPSHAEPFLARIQPATTMSPDDEAVVARLLNAIERLRSERDALRRDLHFTRVEDKMVADALRAKLAAVENEAGCAVMDSQTLQAESPSGDSAEIQRLNNDLLFWQRKVTETDSALLRRTEELQACNAELANVRAQTRAPNDSVKFATTLAKNGRIALSSLIIVGHIRSGLDEAETSNQTLRKMCANLTEIRDHLMEAREQAETALLEVTEARDASLSAQESLHARVLDMLQTVQDRDNQIADMHAQLSEFQAARYVIEQELADAREELDAAEARYSEYQLSALASVDVEAASALKTQLEVFEQRVLRRTEQIGMQQHDIKRLETNLRVAEDTISELNIEVETLRQEKVCLVEDCGQAREARDEAHRRIETLEVEVETLTTEPEELSKLKNALRDAEAEITASEERIEALIHVLADHAARSRAFRVDRVLTATRLSAVETALRTAEASHLHSRSEVERLTSELDSKILMLNVKSTDIETITHELSSAKEEIHHLSSAFESFKLDVQSREEDTSNGTSNLTATLQDLEERLAAVQASRDALSQDLKSSKHAEMTLQSRLVQAQEDAKLAAIEAERLSLAVSSLEAERLSHSDEVERAQHKFEARLMELEAQLEEHRVQHLSLKTHHEQIIQDFIAKNEDLKARLAEADIEPKRRASVENELRRLKDEHAEEVDAVRLQLHESVAQIEILQERLSAAADTIRELEAHVETAIQRHEAAQVEIRGLEHALASTRAQLDEHDTSIQALQREKILLQGEHTRLEAELEKTATKFQYLEQHARRSDQDVVKLKAEVDRLGGEAAKFDEAAQKAEVSLSLKTVQFEQKFAMMQRELRKQQEHHHCQENAAELKEKNEYLEEMLRMKSVEIEENDDRFIEALKEKKRLNGKIESLTRKIQSLQTKLAAVAPQSSPSPSAGFPMSRPKTPPPPVPSSTHITGSCVRSGTRIPSSPGAVLRSKTPEPSRSQLASRAAPKPPVPPLPPMFKTKTPERQSASHTSPRVEEFRPINAQPSGSRINASDTPPVLLSSGSRKRRAPEDFDSSETIPTQAVVVQPSVNLTPRHLRRPTNDGRSGFTPTRNGNVATTRPALTQPSPVRRVTAPLSETTNSPRGGRVLGLGKPGAIAKQPMRSWLSRSRPPAGGVDARSTGALGVGQ